MDVEILQKKEANNTSLEYRQYNMHQNKINLKIFFVCLHLVVDLWRFPTFCVEKPDDSVNQDSF